MKITEIETFVVDAGWRPWQFVAVRTSDGITGYGEISDGRTPYGIVGTINDLEPVLIGRDPLAVEARYWDMYRMARQSPGGVVAKAIAGVELALWDIKGKALGVPVYSLFGGPTRERQLIYWSHCGSSRARNFDRIRWHNGDEWVVGAPPVRTMDDVVALGAEVRAKGFHALKTNILFPGNPTRTFGLQQDVENIDSNTTPAVLRHVPEYIGALKAGAGPDVQIALDINFNCTPLAARQICQSIEHLEMMWVEIDMYDAEALADVRSQTTVPITSGENLYTVRDYLPFLHHRSMDNVMIDVCWQGFSRSRDVALLAESYELNVAPHNYYSHLASMHALHLCASVPNVRIMEIDIDDVPWKDDITGGPIEIVDGHLPLPTKPGWGVDLDENLARQKIWEKGRGPGFSSGRN
ncbi:MAG: mandelate racemase/muconate lactonizing enzyme family protein [Chloroflexi bacterium]|nr:mandelate racemase/muconate lactonizing enzyme family protein [Chloroflexota bacterium]